MPRFPGRVDDVVGRPGETVEGMNVGTLVGREQPGGEKVAATVLTVDLQALGVRFAETGV
jgi:hypothetical protein